MYIIHCIAIAITMYMHSDAMQVNLGSFWVTGSEPNGSF